MPAEAMRADGQSAACTAGAQRERLAAMFLGEGKRPRASGFGRCAAEPTAHWVVVARDALSEKQYGFWSMYGDEAKAGCAPDPLDEMDALGFLGADMFGPGLLLHADDANSLGKQMQTQAGRTDAALKAARKKQSDAVRLAKGVAKKVEAAETAGRAACEKALGKAANLKLESCRFQVVGAKRKAPEPPPAPVQTDHETDADTVLAAKALARDAAAAVAARDAAANHLKRAQKARDKLGPIPPGPAEHIGTTHGDFQDHCQMLRETAGGRQTLVQLRRWWERHWEPALERWLPAIRTADKAVEAAEAELTAAEEAVLEVTKQQAVLEAERVAADVAAAAFEEALDTALSFDDAMDVCNEERDMFVAADVVVRISRVAKVWEAEGRHVEASALWRRFWQASEEYEERKEAHEKGMEETLDECLRDMHTSGKAHPEWSERCRYCAAQRLLDGVEGLPPEQKNAK